MAVPHGVEPVDLRVASTLDLDATLLAAARRLMDDAFRGDFGDEDWDHALGGQHVVLLDDGELVTHASVVERTVWIGERPFRTGYVEAVATAPAHQGRGCGTLAMRRIGELIVQHFELGALATGEHGFYERLGWEHWRGPSSVRTGERLVRTEEDDDGIMVLRTGPSAGIDLASPISCEARPGDDW